jgi:hypothetical protein
MQIVAREAEFIKIDTLKKYSSMPCVIVNQDGTECDEADDTGADCMPAGLTP